jgi:hypothetical protein
MATAAGRRIKRSIPMQRPPGTIGVSRKSVTGKCSCFDPITLSVFAVVRIACPGGIFTIGVIPNIMIDTKRANDPTQQAKKGPPHARAPLVFRDRHESW